METEIQNKNENEQLSCDSKNKCKEGNEKWINLKKNYKHVKQKKK